jgi:ABC-type dipeptide/oligopeptide/nickel transport system permease component
MIKFIARRLAILPFALLLVHFLGYSYAHLVRPMRAERNPFLAETTKDQEPLFTAYSSYWKQVFEGEFGEMKNPWKATRGGLDKLQDVIMTATKASLGLLGLALAVSIVLGVSIGVVAARFNPPSVARWMTTVSTFGMAMPSFFIGSLFFAAWFLYAMWSPSGVLPLPLSGFGWDKHLIMPVVVLMARPTVQIAQMTAGFLVDELGSQYVVAARSVGNTWRRIRRRNAFHNILAPVILTIAGSTRWLVGELIVVEWLFDWWGLGNLLSQTLIPPAINSFAAQEGIVFLNPAVVAAVLMIFGGIFILTDLFASVLAKLFDPRLREG